MPVSAEYLNHTNMCTLYTPKMCALLKIENNSRLVNFTHFLEKKTTYFLILSRFLSAKADELTYM